MATGGKPNPTPTSVKQKYESQLTSRPGVVGVVAHPDKLVIMVESRDVEVPSQLDGVRVEKRIVGKLEI